MKKQFYLIIFTCQAMWVNAQTASTFDNLTLLPNSYWNGSDLTGGFTSGNAFFPNYYDTSWGGYWAGGWAYSNQTDSTLQTSSPAQLYNSRAGGGFNMSANFAVGTQGSVLKLTGISAGKALSGVYITNSTYAYNSMKLGDAFAKQFGGASGNDPDFFKLTIKKYLGGILAADSVEFYLADYRFSNNAQDYIIKDWAYVNLLPLGNCDSLLFTLASSDNGAWGMNTPAYYCIDNFLTLDSPAHISENSYRPVLIFPTLCSDFLNISAKEHTQYTIEVYDMSGRNLKVENFIGTQHKIDVSTWPTGMYQLVVWLNYIRTDYKFIKP
jgi:hypothetical protein